VQMLLPVFKHYSEVATAALFGAIAIEAIAYWRTYNDLVKNYRLREDKYQLRRQKYYAEKLEYYRA